MEELERLVQSINIDTKHLYTDKIQAVLVNAKRHKKSSENNVELWNKLAEALWCHIENGLDKIDDQLLCSTCFFSVIILTDKQELYIAQMQDVIQKNLASKCADSKSCSSLHAMSLMYGMFQSSFLTENIQHSNLIDVIKSTFDLLIHMGYEYSQFTFMAFKTIYAFKKICGTDLEHIIFSQENQVKLLNLVNHNWENPITGVRDLIKGIFQTLVNILAPDALKHTVDEINGFYWNKAKYLMLSEIFNHHCSEISLLSDDWIDGLMNSLHKPGLVSAGADMYYAVLKKINTEAVWCKLFQKRIVKILKGPSNKAIENFGNYWVLITLKKFPQLLNTLTDEFNDFGCSDHEYYSILVLMKQGSKLGIFDRNRDSSEKHTNYEEILLPALEHCNTQVRILAFDIICLSPEKSLPSNAEYTLILHYLRHNINSDCTVLRINMLNSLSIFLSQVHILFRNMSSTESTETEDLLNFLMNIQEVVLTSLNLNGNYQRKCTNVKLINVIIDCCSQVPKKRKGHVKSTSISLEEFLQSKSCWKFHNETTVMKLISLLKDPSDDIRENVGKLLLNHYSEELRKPQIMDKITQNAVESMRSKFFYEISCGQSMFKLIVSLLFNENLHEGNFKSLEDVFYYGFTELEQEYKANQDVLKTIEDGKQLHSFISILQVVLETCVKNSYQLGGIEDKIKSLLNILQHIANQFAWEQQNATSSDFSKMNEMVEGIIAKAGHSDDQNKDETKISGLHQIVLNCLWLNVKASCDLASLIIGYYKDDVEICENCLNIITHVLETSRHKGAIEAAGTALGCSIQLLTSLPESAKTSQLPQTLLKAKLDILIREATKMASITRRGAGLSIMVHRIVSSDMRKSKPLFHYFMKTLLQTCQSTDDVPSSQVIENQMDLPKAIFIHFLTKIVMDSSLASDLMFYSAELAELAFSNLTSSHWQIRNAALQLYGALIPRLIGQKKASGSDDETIATVACDELRTHSPKLWRFIMAQLKSKNNCSDIISHSDLVPILNLLASCAKRYNFSSDTRKQLVSDKELLNSLIRIINSPIHTVRRLTARCIFNIFSLEDICNALNKAEFLSENFVHGALMLLQFFHKSYNLNNMHDSTAKSIRHLCEKMLKSKQDISYCSKEVYVTLYPKELIASNDMRDTLKVLNVRDNSPGIHKWAQTCVEAYLMHSQWDDILVILKSLLDQKDFEVYGEILLSKMEKENCYSESTFQQIANTLLSYNMKYQSCVIWKILYKIACVVNLKHADIPAILDNLEGKEVSYKLRYVIPFATKMFLRIDIKHQEMLTKLICEISDFETADVDMRYIAGLANNELPKCFDKVSDNVKIASLKTVILLLQDEDEDVRNVCVNYYKNMTKTKIAVHPNICLNRMLRNDFLVSLFEDSQAVNTLCNELLMKTSKTVHDNDEYNPFANDSKNIYLEVEVLRTTLENLLQNLE